MKKPEEYAAEGLNLVTTKEYQPTAAFKQISRMVMFDVLQLAEQYDYEGKTLDKFVADLAKVISNKTLSDKDALVVFNPMYEG